MTRISKTVMERMAKAIVMHAYGEQAEALVRESIELFNLVYLRHHHPITLKHMVFIIAKHPKAFEHDNSAQINLSGRRFTVGNRRIAEHWRSETQTRPVLQDFDTYPGIAITGDDELFCRFAAFADAEKDLTDEVMRAYEEALGSLGQFSTVKALRTKWPEVLSVVEHLLPEDNRLLPVVEVKHLNDRFKLPAVAV